MQAVSLVKHGHIGSSQQRSAGRLIRPGITDAAARSLIRTSLEYEAGDANTAAAKHRTKTIHCSTARSTACGGAAHSNSTSRHREDEAAAVHARKHAIQHGSSRIACGGLENKHPSTPQQHCRGLWTQHTLRATSDEKPRGSHTLSCGLKTLTIALFRSSNSPTTNVPSDLIRGDQCKKLSKARGNFCRPTLAGLQETKVPQKNYILFVHESPLRVLDSSLSCAGGPLRQRTFASLQLPLPSASSKSLWWIAAEAVSCFLTRCLYPATCASWRRIRGCISSRVVNNRSRHSTHLTSLGPVYVASVLLRRKLRCCRLKPHLWVIFQPYFQPGTYPGCRSEASECVLRLSSPALFDITVEQPA